MYNLTIIYLQIGTGKTLLARAIASECKTRKINFISSSIADILCKWVGESEKRLADLFKKVNINCPEDLKIYYTINYHLIVAYITYYTRV